MMLRDDRVIEMFDSLDEPPRRLEAIDIESIGSATTKDSATRVLLLGWPVCSGRVLSSFVPKDCPT